MITSTFEKIILTFKWFFGIKFLLKKPIENFSYQKKKKNSIGEWYQETVTFNKNIEVKSPVKGKIGKIYLNNSASLITKFGLEIIVLIKLNGNSNNFRINFLKNKEEKVDTKDIIFTVESIEENINEVTVSVIVPWQPLVIGKIEKNSISYRNPFLSLKVKNVWSY